MFNGKKFKNLISSTKGFTLMELVIVMAILAVLVTLALLYYGNVGQDAYRNALLADLKAVDQAVSLYENSYAALPVVESAIIDLEDKTTGNANVPATLKVDTAIDAYTIDATNANFMSYIKKTTYVLKGVETGDVRGAGKLYYINAADDVATGTGQAGAAGTITLAAGANATDDFYNHCTIYITGGTGAGQAREISDYAGGTKVATVNSNWVTNPDATSTYTVKAPVKAGDIVFVQTATTDRNIIKDTNEEAIYKY